MVINQNRQGRRLPDLGLDTGLCSVSPPSSFLGTLSAPRRPPQPGLSGPPPTPSLRTPKPHWWQNSFMATRFWVLHSCSSCCIEPVTLPSPQHRRTTDRSSRHTCRVGGALPWCPGSCLHGHSPGLLRSSLHQPPQGEALRHFCFEMPLIKPQPPSAGRCGSDTQLPV